ncbi:MAG: FxsA family protein [Pseudomonadota bacterium]
MPFLFLLFIVMPIIEIAVLIEVGSKIGVFNTIGLVILTAIVGTMMLRNQGLSMLTRVREQMSANQVPAMEILEGMFLVIGGALLLTPGFVTDAIGFLCLIPVTRAFMARALINRFHVTGAGAAHTHHYGRRGPVQKNHTIEGDFHRED